MKLFETLAGRVKLEKLISLLTIAAVVVSTACLMLVMHLQLTADAERKAIENQQLSLRIGAELLSVVHPESQIVRSPDNAVEKIVIDALPEDKGYELVDSMTRMTGEPFTLFRYDAAAEDFQRVSTTVKSADGTRAVGTWLGKNSPAYAAIKKSEPYNGAADILGTPYFTIYFPIVDRSSNVIGILFAGTKQSVVFELAAALEKKILLASAALLLVMAIAGHIVSRMLTRPIPVLAEVMARLARNDADGAIPYTDQANEIGEMARAVAIFRDNTLERTKLESERTREAARREARQKALEALIEGFKSDAEQTIAALAVMAADLEQTAGSLQGIASGTNDKAQLVATASDQASANVGTVAAAAEELTASIAEIGNQISEALNNVSSTSSVAMSTNQRMSELLASAQQIGEVVTLIREIAGQTNLLALNATIEAARAGEAGRGFAVVATEVKTLATRTAQATESISEQVSSIQAATDQAVRAIGDIAERMGHVNGITTQIAAAVTEQGAATSEINASVHHAAGDTRHVSETIAGVTEAATATFNSARQVLETSARVSARTKALSARIESFLSGVAAA
ncbi:methyl-accepting chemotaxis protein [Hyphomicrobium sp.]|uniref:methyl-accepting chemotaxis protein n=1 Tax=Hyphomicrobium sp. TaxID=82 RepID=UPI002E3565BE|nr:methyl-accepting chemotaxis protein [Hyphomicrobium sp.]HEX2843224.1 methyl-accepting chemotaxis protein [Hyphomicrobium sp.]